MNAYGQSEVFCLPDTERSPSSAFKPPEKSGIPDFWVKIFVQISPILAYFVINLLKSAHFLEFFLNFRIFDINLLRALRSSTSTKFSMCMLWLLRFTVNKFAYTTHPCV